MKYLLISALLLSTQASASDQSEYQQWLQQTRSDFQSYLDENDKAFISPHSTSHGVDLLHRPVQQRLNYYGSCAWCVEILSWVDVWSTPSWCAREQQTRKLQAPRSSVRVTC